MHHHHRGPGHRPPQQPLLIAIFVTGLFCAVEVVGGWLSGSLALLSDAGHMLSDLFALGLSLFALRLATRPATPSKTYGYLRIEILSALANGVLLSLVAFAVLSEAWQRLRTPHAVRGELMLGVAFLGLLANLVAALALHRSAHRSLNVRGAYLHVLGDLLSSLAVLIGGALILLTGRLWIDAAIGALIGCVILWSAQKLVRESVDILLEASPKGVHALDVERIIAEVPGVVGLHDLHVWSLTTGVESLSAHVLVRPADLPHTDRILGDINQRLLDRFGISHTTLQIESDPGSHSCAVPQ